MEDKKQAGYSRRRFLTLGVGSVGAVITLGYIGVGGIFLDPPAASAETLQEVGQVSEFKERVPKLIAYKGSGVEEGVYVVNMGEEGWVALDFHCTHLQCAVNWVEATKQFMCPCHGGVYDLKGNVVSGPPPKALPRRVISVQGDSVKVGGMLT